MSLPVPTSDEKIRFVEEFVIPSFDTELCNDQTSKARKQWMRERQASKGWPVDQLFDELIIIYGSISSTVAEERLKQLHQQNTQGDGSIIYKLVKSVEEMAIDQKEIAIDQKRVNFAVKLMTDSLPPNIGIVLPSEDCKTDKSGKYRSLMRALKMNETNNVLSLATSIDQQECDVKEFSFTWNKNSNEGESYEPFQTYLKTEFKMNAVILAYGEGLADRNLFVSDIYTLRPKLGDLTSDLKKAALGQEPQFRFRIRGRTDLGVFKDRAVLGCGDLLIAFEIKPNNNFSKTADINRALREGVLQLIGTNADNHYSSPVVIVTALVRGKHYLLYLELEPYPEIELRYNLCVKSSTSLSQLIHFAQTLCKRVCITSRFAAPPTPTKSPQHDSPDKDEKEQEDEKEEEEEDFDAGNVSIESGKWTP